MSNPGLQQRIQQAFDLDASPGGGGYQCRICGASVAQIQVERPSGLVGLASHYEHIDGRVLHLKWHDEHDRIRS